MLAVWQGDATDPWAEEIVIGTAGAALLALSPGRTLTETEAEARTLWSERTPRIAA